MRGRRRARPDYHRRVLRIRSLRLVGALKPAGVLAILLALGSVVVAAPAAAATTRDVAVVVVPDFDPGAYADKGAVGLFVPGAGSTVSRERALASLVRGRVISSLVHLDGDEILRLSEAPAATTIYVALPPPGSRHNVVRYPVAIVGSGYSGLLRSESTRIDGLVSLADIAPSALALARGEAPPITARSDADPAATLERLDERLTRAHDAREGATLVLVGWMVGLALVGLLARSATAGRAAVLAAPVALAAALLVRALGIDEPRTVVAILAIATGIGSIVLGLRREILVPAVVAMLVMYLITLAAWPEVNALAAIGPHPDGGGRFYGVTNQVGTLVLAPALAAAASLGVAGAVAIGLLLVVTVGWSRAGADGGGLVVVVTAFVVLLAGQRRVRPTPLRLVAGAAVVVGVGLAIVGADALLGGSSHVTNAVSGGPGTVLDDLDRRLRISWAGATTSVHTVLLCVVGLVGLAWLGFRGRRSPPIVAMVAAIGVSLIVNDTPVDVLCYGALGCLTLTAWAETRDPRAVSERTVRSTRPPVPEGLPEH